MRVRWLGSTEELRTSLEQAAVRVGLGARVSARVYKMTSGIWDDGAHRHYCDNEQIVYRGRVYRDEGTGLGHRWSSERLICMPLSRWSLTFEL